MRIRGKDDWKGGRRRLRNEGRKREKEGRKEKKKEKKRMIRKITKTEMKERSHTPNYTRTEGRNK